MSRLGIGKKKQEGAAVRVVLYSKPDCHLCDVAKEELAKLQAELPFEVDVIDIRSDPDLYERYKEEIPVVFINGRKAFKYRIDPQRFRRLIRRAAGAG